MPKNKKTKKKTKKIKKPKEEAGLEEELLSEKLTELAEAIERVRAKREIDDNQFHTFMQAPDETGSPILEKIASAPEIITRGPMTTTPATTDNKKDDAPFKYTAGVETPEQEIKYISSSSEIRTTPETVDFSQIGRTRQTPFTHQMQLKDFSDSIESDRGPKNYQTQTPERLDTEKAGRKSPFEKEKRKYEPKLPR